MKEKSRQLEEKKALLKKHPLQVTIQFNFKSKYFDSLGHSIIIVPSPPLPCWCCKLFFPFSLIIAEFLFSGKNSLTLTFSFIPTLNIVTATPSLSLVEVENKPVLASR